MDDLQFGTRNKRGDWAPTAHLELPPFWRHPFGLPRVLAWIPEYRFPWNAFHMATALVWWFFVVPDVTTMQTLSWTWALWLYAVNATAIFVFLGTMFVYLGFLLASRAGFRRKWVRLFPTHEDRDHDEHDAPPVGVVENIFGVWIVRRPERVGADPLQQLEVMQHVGIVVALADHRYVLVPTEAGEIERLAVDQCVALFDVLPFERATAEFDQHHATCAGIEHRGLRNRHLRHRRAGWPAPAPRATGGSVPPNWPAPGFRS